MFTVGLSTEVQMLLFFSGLMFQHDGKKKDIFCKRKVAQ